MKRTNTFKGIFLLSILLISSIATQAQMKNIDAKGLSDNLVGYFSFDDPGSGIQCDYGTGAGNTGTLVGDATFTNSVTKYSGSALEIDPSMGDAYATFDLNNSQPFRMEGASAITIAMWVQPHQLGEQYIVAATQSNGNDSYRVEITSENLFKTHIETRNTEGAMEYSNGNAQSLNHKLGEDVNLNEWIHVAAVYSTEDGKARIFINGVQSGEYTNTDYNLVTFTTRLLNIGADFATGISPNVQRQFDGIVDELYFFDRALDVTEINTLKDIAEPLEDAPTYSATFDLDYDGLMHTETAINYNDYMITIPTVEREGYTLDGWYTAVNGGGSKLTSSEVQVLGDMTYYANWIADTYTVTLNKEAGSEMESFQITDLPKTIAVDTKGGSTFVGWFSDNHQEEVLIDNQITAVGDITLWSVFTSNPTYYTVTLESEGEVFGKRIATEETNYTVPLPVVPNREDNYRFAGWYTAQNGGGEEVTSYSTISADVTLYADWSEMVNTDENTLDIDGLSDNLIAYFSFDAHGDGDVVSTDGVATGVVGTFSGAGAKLTSSDQVHTTSALEIDNAYVSFDMDNSADIRMEGASAMSLAVWVKPHQLGEQHILALTSDFGGDSYRLEIGTNNRFKAFISTYENGALPEYSNGNAQSLAHELGNEVNLNEWIHVAYVYNSALGKTIIYVNGEFSGEYVNTDYKLVTFNDKKLSIGANYAASRTPDAVQKQYDGLVDELYFFDRALSIDEINTLKDLGNPTEALTEFIAVFDPSNGEEADTLKTTVLDNYEVDPTSISDPSREAYVFSGWYTGRNGTGVQFDHNSTATLTEDVVLYAYWTPYVYTITLNKDSGEETETFVISDLPRQVSEDTKGGANFTGWFKDEFFDEVLVNSEITEIGDIELWADFSTDPTFYTVTLMDNGTLNGERIAKAENEFKASLPNLSTRDDNTRFAGWYTGANGTGDKVDAYTVITADVTLYSHFTAMEASDEIVLDIDALSDNLVGYFSFDTNADGDVVVDKGTAAGNTGDFVGAGATLNTADFQYSTSALELDNAYVGFDLDNSEEFRMEGASAISFACWIKPHSSANSYIFATTDDDGNDSYSLEIKDGFIKTIINTYDPSGPDFKNGNTQSTLHQFGDEINVNEWIHVAVVYNSADATTYMYINGTLSGSYSTFNYNLVTFNTRKLNIGADVFQTPTPTVQGTYDGLIDELYFFDRVLSETEIQTLKDLNNPIEPLREFIAVFDHGDGETFDTLRTTQLSNYEVDPTGIVDPSKEAYTFQGWYTGRNGTGDEFSTDALVTIMDDVVLYPYYTLVPYTLTLNKDAGQETEMFYITDLDKTIADDIKGGENFTGWFTDENRIELLLESKITTIGDQEIWSGFSTDANFYTVKLYNEGELYGGRVATLENEYKITLPDLPTREDNYRFAGWYTEDNGEGTRITDFSDISSNARIKAVAAMEEILYAYWEPMLSDEYVQLNVDGLSDNLIGYFSFDSTSTVANDMGTAEGTEGTINGAVAMNTADQKYTSQALDFSGGYIDFDLASSELYRMEGASALTIAMWVQPHKTGQQYLFNTISSSGGEGIRLEIGSDNRFRTTISTGSSPTFATASAFSSNHQLGSDLNLNEWVHVAAVYDKDNTNVTIYVNGVISGSFVNNTYDVVAFSDRKLKLGAHVVENDGTPIKNFFDGLMDELYVYDRALTATEIQNLRDLSNPTEGLLEYIAVFNHRDGLNADTLRTTILDNYAINSTVISDPILADHDFKGWYSQTNGEGTEYTLNAFDLLNDDVIYYANWEDVSAGPALPVELINFSGEINNEEVLLKWSTAWELNNDKFVIQRSNNQRDWNVLAEVDGHGNTDFTIHYDFVDRTYTTGVNYYRLKQIDFDGSYSYSDIIEILNDEGKDLQLITYPNPFQDHIKVYSSEEIDLTGLKVFTTQGQPIQFNVEMLNPHEVEIKTATWSTGVYIVKYKETYSRILKK